MIGYQNYGTGAQLAPQGLFGSLLGAPLGGLIGGGIGGLFGNSNLGKQIGQAAGGIGGGFLPFSADPVAAAQAQQMQMQQLQQAQLAQQLAPQGWLGNLIGQVGAPLGGAIGGLFGNQGLGSTIGGVAGKLGSMLPFSADPVAQAYAQQQAMQQAQLSPQGWFGNLIGQVGAPLGGAIGGLFGNQGLGSTIGGVAGKLGSMLPFGADPVSLAYAQQAAQQPLAPQGWLGNIIGQVGRPLGGAIGGLLGNAGLGSTIGGVAGQLGQMLPFGADPVALAYAQQAAQQQQLAPQGWLGNIIGQVGRPLGGAIGGLFGNAGLGSTIGGVAGQLGQMLPFGADPVSQQMQQLQQLQQLQQIQQTQQLQQMQQLAQQGQPSQQVSPQGWLGNLIGQVGRPLGGAIGGMFGNAGLGSTIGGVAGQLGQMLPFGADPVSQQIQAAQMAQLAPQGFLSNIMAQRYPITSQFGTGMCSPSMGSSMGSQILPFGADPYTQQGQPNSLYTGMQYGGEPTLH